MADKITWLCPVCGFVGLSDPPYDYHGSTSFDIYPSCGTELGYEDSTRSHAELRKAWLESGASWLSQTMAPPNDWNAEAQLQAAGFLTR